MISSNSNRKIKQLIQWQNSAKERKSAGVFVAEGFKMYEEAPQGAIQEVYLSEGALDRLHGAEKEGGKGEGSVLRKLEKTGYEVVSDALFCKMSDTRTPQGILCVVRQPSYRLERLLETPVPVFVVLENLQDPGNLGTILRTGEGAGITGVIMDRETVDIFNPKVIRGTMGSIFRLPFVYVDDLGKLIERFRARRIYTYAAHLAGEKYYSECYFKGGTAFLIGNEGKGLREETGRLADSYLKIPMEGKVESLNAAVAASILMYEAHRQRRLASAGVL